MIISLADRLQGVKTYYFVQKLEQIRSMIAEGHDVISFGIGSPDLKPDEQVINALGDAANKPDKHGYQAYKGIPELREAMASFYKSTYGVDLKAHEEILPLMGSKEGILHITLAFINQGDEILVPDPGYPTYTSLPTLLGAKVRKYDLKEENGWYPDFDQLENMDLSKVKMLWVNYPHMPTGTPAKKEVFVKLVELCKLNNILLCHDNPYSLVLNQKEPVSILSVPGASDVAVEFNSLSKSHNMAGWRVGMMTGSKDVVDACLRVKSNIDSGMYYGLQAAATEALSLEPEWHAERNEVYAERRAVAWKVLDKLGFEYSKEQEGMFVWAKPKANSGIDDIPAFIDKMLEEKHVFFTPGMIFGSNGEGYLRLSICVKKERMEQALARL